MVALEARLITCDTGLVDYSKAELTSVTVWRSLGAGVVIALVGVLTSSVRFVTPRDAGFLFSFFSSLAACKLRMRRF